MVVRAQVQAYNHRSSVLHKAVCFGVDRNALVEEKRGGSHSMAVIVSQQRGQDLAQSMAKVSGSGPEVVALGTKVAAKVEAVSVWEVVG